MFDNMDKSTIYSIISLSIIISIIILFFSWIATILSIKTTDCTNLEKKTKKYLYNNNKYVNEKSNQELTDSLKNFYIKTAYNCCNPSGYKNSFVNVCALEHAIKLGAKCLDFELYSVNDEPIIASSSVNNITFKETFDYIPLKEFLNKLDDMQGQYANLFNDPIFLHLRIKSNQSDMYKNMAIEFDEFFQNFYFEPELSKKQQLTLKNIKNLQKTGTKSKIIIMVDLTSISIQATRDFKSSDFNKYVNLYNKEDYYLFRFSDLNADNKLLRAQVKKDIHIILPDLNSKTDNYDFYNAYECGCQMIGMKFQVNDANLRNYLEFFKNEPFKLKRGELRDNLYVAKKYTENNPLVTSSSSTAHNNAPVGGPPS